MPYDNQPTASTQTFLSSIESRIREASIRMQENNADLCNKINEIFGAEPANKLSDSEKAPQPNCAADAINARMTELFDQIDRVRYEINRLSRV